MVKKYRIQPLIYIFIAIIIILQLPLVSSAPEETSYDHSMHQITTWNRDMNQNGIDDLLDEKLETGELDSELVNLYINYYSIPSNNDISNLERLGLNISYIAQYIPTICVREVPMGLINQIKLLPNIEMIELQPYLRPLLDVSARAIKARESEEYSPEAAWELGYTGRNVNIAILDTGVDDRHESLLNKYVMGYDCTLRVPRETNPDDEDGHGTHCAGIAMGTGGEDGQYIGVAPNAKLIDVKVLNDIGLTPGDQIIMGIEWCINQKDEYDIDILSISIGDLFTGNDDGTHKHAELIEEAVEAGLVVIVAGGNDGPNNNGFSTLAAADGAITVGAVDELETTDRSDDEIASFSNRGPRADDGDGEGLDELKPDVVAPGVDIMSAWGSPVGTSGLGYISQSGTSMACPHVAGAAALLLEANPNLTPAEIKQIIKETAEPRGHASYADVDPDYNVNFGWGIIDAFEAVRKVIGEDYQTIQIESHEPFDEVHNIISINGRASVSKGNIQKVEFNINDGEWATAEGQDEWSFEFDTTTVKNGLQTINIRSSDGIEYSQVYDLVLNVVNIGCEFLEPTNGSVVKGTVLIQGTGFGSGVSNIQIKIDDDVWEPVEPTSGGNNFTTWEYSWNSKKVGDGVHTLRIRAYNFEWYSIPNGIEVIVENKSESSSGFIPGFDLLLLIICITLCIIITKRARK
jgi:subtilisin family serine protease